MGKTAVFVLSVLQRIDFQNPDPVSCLVLANTRELAYQINKEFVRMGKYIPTIKSRVFYGGTDVRKDIKVLREDPPTVVVGTPGRIYDLKGGLVARMQKHPTLNPRFNLYWDGKANGRRVPSGVYIYQLEAENKIFTGTVVVVR